MLCLSFTFKGVKQVNKLTIIDPRFGDTTLEFNVKDETSVAKAREEFRNRVRQGYTGITEDGKVSKSFDINERETFLLMPMVGG